MTLQMPHPIIFHSNGSPSGQQEAIHILLIEDNYGDARLVQILLADSDLPNVKITHELTLKDGITALSDRDFALVLLDLTLPDSRGFETLEKLIATKPDVNVVVMTGLDDKVLGLNAVKAGAQDFLMKNDLNADLLSKTLRYAIERKTVLIKLATATRAREVAEESARMKEQFIASISHEMRTPMNAIYGMSNLLAQTQLDEEQRSFIDSVRQSSEILLGVINDILEISTMQNGRIDFTTQGFDLFELMFNVVNVMQYKKEEKPLEFQLAIDPSVPTHIGGDKLRLNQILFNIVGNAVKFTDMGFIKINVETFDNQQDTIGIKFIIEDSGIGIPADKIDTIFESFTRIRTKERIFEGTGLGLAIVKNLVTQQGGRVTAKSTPQEGTTITVEMTFDKMNGNFSNNSVEIPEKYDFDASKSRVFSLLLVEDHKMNQIVARKTLEKQFENITIKIAENGLECLDILRGGDIFDIILMDIQMPIMDGNETIAYIRKNMPDFKTPVLAMTAHAFLSKDDCFKDYGFDDLVLKPFDRDPFLAKIHQYLIK